MTEIRQGRPTAYSAELAAEICRLLADGKTLREVCRDETMPPESTVRGWVTDNREGFSAQYAQARAIGYHGMADEILEIADQSAGDYKAKELDGGATVEVVDHEHIQRSRLRVDTRKWLLSKALPKIYGDKVEVEHAGPGGGPIKTQDVTPRPAMEVARRLAFLLTKGLKAEPQQADHGPERRPGAPDGAAGG